MMKKRDFEDGFRKASAQRDNKKRLQLRDMKEKVLKRLQGDYENISKWIEGFGAEWKRLGGPDKPELELILENLSLNRASVKSKILAAAIVRALDVQEEADLDGWYVIRAATRESRCLDPGFSEWEDVLHVVNAIIHKLELAEEEARVDVVSRYYGKKGGDNKAKEHAITKEEIKLWNDYAVPRLAQDMGINQIVRQIQRSKEFNPCNRKFNGIYNHFRPKKPTE